MLLSAASGADSYLQFMTVLIIFIFVLVLTYLVTRWIAQYQKGKVGTGNLEILETCRLASDKYIQIVRAGKRYLVVAVGKSEVHMLSELSADEINFWQDAQQNDQQNAGVQTIDFAGILDKARKLKERDKD